VLAADATHRCIHRYDKKGKFINDIGRKPGRKGFLLPNGHLDLCVDTQGVICATNSGKHRVERYTLEGELLGHFGKFSGPDPTGFSGCCNPTNVALAPKGTVVVTVKAPPGIKVYDTEGKLLSIIDGAGFDPNCKNMDVAVDSKGRIYAVDTVRLQICVFAPADTSEPKQAGQGAVKR
jgi:sugar lactone lactonase YvrE